MWQRYFARLVGLARQKLHGVRPGLADGEDVALSAFYSFCQAAEGGKFPDLQDRGNLWPLLVLITARKAGMLRRQEGRQKRGSGRVLGERDLADAAVHGLANLVGPEPTPEFALQVAEECDRLLAVLNDADLQFIARAKMEGHTNEEIANQLGCVPRTVERRLQVIRSLWAHENLP